LGFNQFDIGHLDRQSLQVRVTGAPVKSWLKFIKAVTYHDLSIRETGAGLEATLVIDV
jgi:SHS2 domain-containing protein